MGQFYTPHDKQMLKDFLKWLDNYDRNGKSADLVVADYVKATGDNL